MSLKGIETDNGLYEFQPFRDRQERSWRTYIWNPDTKEFCGRTFVQWLKLFLYYGTFYSILALIFFICMMSMMQTMDFYAPKYQLHNSLIGTNPGLAIRPMSLDNDNENVKIEYNQTDGAYNKWVQHLDKFLEPYKKNDTQRVFCDFQIYPAKNESCEIDLDTFGHCAGGNYGYNSSKPCIFVKLNKIFNWIPQVYNDTKDLPDEMPMDLKEDIKNLPDCHLDQIWVSCKGIYEDTKEELDPNNFIYHTRGFPSYFYPYRNTKDYISPLVAVQIDVKPNTLLNVECRVWAKNIKYSKSKIQREGSTVFQIISKV